MTAALSVFGLRVAYGGVQALDDVHLDVTAGECVGLVGPNGAGKTTLLDAISGFVRLDEGRVAITGRDVTRLAPAARAGLGLARTFQDARLFPDLTVGETLAVAGRGVRSPIAVRLGLAAYLDARVRDCPPGVRRLVDVACVLVRAPSVVLLDEPSAGLSAAEVAPLPGLLDAMRRDTGAAVLVVEHDRAVLDMIATRRVEMAAGCLTSLASM